MSRKSHSTKGPSQRQLRVGELVRHALVDVLTRDEIDDPALSVTEVAMSPDLKIATVFVSLLGAADSQPVIKALADNARFLRGRLAPALRQMKFMPELRFRIDTSFDNYSRIDQLLKSDRVIHDLDTADASED